MFGAGQRVKAGQALVQLSAMKMETAAAAPCDGVVRHVAVEAKDSVEAGEAFSHNRIARDVDWFHSSFGGGVKERPSRKWRRQERHQQAPINAVAA